MESSVAMRGDRETTCSGVRQSTERSEEAKPSSTEFEDGHGHEYEYVDRDQRHSLLGEDARTRLGARNPTEHVMSLTLVDSDGCAFVSYSYS